MSTRNHPQASLDVSDGLAIVPPGECLSTLQSCGDQSLELACETLRKPTQRPTMHASSALPEDSKGQC